MYQRLSSLGLPPALFQRASENSPITVTDPHPLQPNIASTAGLWCIRGHHFPHSTATLMGLQLPLRVAHLEQSQNHVFYFKEVPAASVTSIQGRKFTYIDPVLDEVMDIVTCGRGGELMPSLKPYLVRRKTIQSGCLLWGYRVIIPPQEANGWRTNSGHGGIVQMKEIAQRWWPGLRSIFSHFGLLQQLLSNNCPQLPKQFEEFKLFMEANEIQHIRMAPYHPATNGLAERFVWTMKQALKASQGQGSLNRHLIPCYHTETSCYDQGVSCFSDV